ncbi:MAG: PAS domain S-box protein [Sulfuritalea sp.]|jgi:PAS domain S-box-containing protein|nr:PAS domain S-box protein [Sulfuritalea sp.]
MTEKHRWRLSLKQKITLGILAIFVVGIWALSFFLTYMLRNDLQSLLASQQASTVSYVAAELNQALVDRTQALEKVARSIDRPILDNPAALQQTLAKITVFQDLFNSGVVAVNLDGIALADAPVVAGRRGTNYASNEATHIALTEGRTVIGRPVVGRVLHQALFNINTPIRDAGGKVIGALFGVINLAKPNFLDRIGELGYGKSGGYMVVAPQYNLVVTATDKNRVMQALPLPGVNPILDQRMQGFDGPGIAVNSLGVEILSSAARIPAAGWFVIALLPTAEAFAPIHDMQIHIASAATLLTLVAGILSWWLLQSQLSPLVNAARQLNEMTGAGKPLNPLPVARHDEIGQLIGGFNGLLETLGQREAQLHIERDFFSALLQQSSDGVLLFNPDDLGIREVNPSLCQLLGYERDELLAMKLGDLVQASPEQVRENVDHVVQSKIHRVGERSYRKRDGTPLDLEVHASLVETGGQLLVMANVRDITERKQVEAELRRHRLHLEEMVVERTAQLRALANELAKVEERERRGIAQDLHDDLGQIIAAIKIKLTSLQLQDKYQWDAELKQQFKDIGAMVDQANRAVRSFSMQLSPPVLSEFGLVSALEWLAEEMLRGNSLNVHIYDEGKPMLLDGTLSNSLFRTVRELLINVSKHAEVDTAEVSVFTDDDKLVITVVDAGVGFNMKHSLTPTADGGYGLFSIRERLSSIGGEMQIDSQPGHGTVVVVTLPLDSMKEQAVNGSLAAAR